MKLAGGADIDINININMDHFDFFAFHSPYNKLVRACVWKCEPLPLALSRYPFPFSIGGICINDIKISNVKEHVWSL